ncbi:YhgE/Pip family protein [Cellulomonas sp. Marseille-Q8402]
MTTTTRRVLTAAVVLLLPLAVGLALLGSLQGRLDRLGAVPAAVVNTDQVVTSGQGSDTQTIAAGRLLAANLTNPPDGTDVGFGWTLTDADDAAAGLADGSYAAVITIPEDFSAAVGSSGGDDPVQATVRVEGDDARSAVSAVLADQVAQVASTTMGQQITGTYLDNVYLGFNQIADQMGQAADGAQQAAAGATSLADGTAQVAAGADQLAAATGELASGAAGLASGAGALAPGAEEVASGAAGLASGTQALAGGAAAVSTGAGSLAAGIAAVDARVHDLPAPAEAVEQDAAALAALADRVSALAARCAGGDLAQCAELRAAVDGAGSLRGLADRVRTGAAGLSGAASGLVAGLDELTAASAGVAAGSAEVATSAGQVAVGAGTLATGASGVASGAEEVDAGATGLAAGAGQAATGAAGLASGARSAADGATSLAGGVGSLADGLSTGAQQVPTYDDDQRSTLATVVAAPVVTDDTTAPLTAQDPVVAPVVVPVAVWLGALVVLLVLPAVPRRAAYEAAGAGRLVLRGWLPVAAVAGGQALLLAVALPLLDLRAANPVGAVLVTVLGAASFAAVNLALAALWGRAGLVVSLAFLALQAAAVGALVPIATAPPFFQAVSGALPVPQLADALGVLLLGADGSWIRPVTGLLLWGVAGLGLTVLAVRRSRVRVPARDLAAARPA